MKQLLILSGKGGTGKTTVAGSLIELFSSKAFADCDVDAPNLHLIKEFDVEPVRSEYYGLQKAKIDSDKCNGCGICFDNCRFNTVHKVRDKYTIDDNCEGCSVCKVICPTKAIEMVDAICGDLMLYKDDVVFSTAKLRTGSGATGKLVSQVKEQLKANADYDGVAIIDGSPGIGCPVVSSLTGVNFVLIVTEPSLSGMSDLERILKVAIRFRVPAAICINKFDLNVENTKIIEKFCLDNDIPCVGKIPFDEKAVEAINNGISVIKTDCPAATAIRGIYEELTKLL